MEVLGIGLPELAFIVLIALILLGPKDMVAAGRTLGRMLRKLITSPTWQVMRHTGEELQRLPTKLMREAGLEELQSLEHEVKDAARQIRPPTFDERQIFGPAASTLNAKPNSDPKLESPTNKPEEPSEPPATPDA